MQENTLYKVSVLIAILGLGFLYLYAEEAELPFVNNLEDVSPQQKVKIEGTLTRLRQADKVMFLQVQGERIETLDIVFFPQETVFLHEGDRVEVEGTVEEYQGQKEIIAESIVIR